MREHQLKDKKVLQPFLKNENHLGIMKKTYHQLNRILIANRGEIAVRIIKTARQMGIKTIAIYTKDEEESLHVEKADFKALLTGDSLEETYLNAQHIVELAHKYKADAIHPGYGFLSENADFARLCSSNNITFIGPTAEQIRLMGNKEVANEIARSCKVPLLKKINGAFNEVVEKASELKLPLIIKAAAGGGGKGMRVINCLKDLPAELQRAAAEAERYFGNPSVYIEEYIENPRHIEVQVLADEHGNTVHLYERECSIQRRHQKVIEEAPAPNLPEKVRQNIINDALTLTKEIDYTSAGTVEFLLTPDMQHYFLEMNTRIQVEHPVTEEITSIDIVKEQIMIASGMPLSFTQEEVKICGHAIEARIYAEDPEDNFMPSFGKIIGTHIPSHPHIRIDGGAQATENLNPKFDPLLKKVISLANNRNLAIARLENFLLNYALFGVESNRELIIRVLKDKDFKRGEYSTSFFKNKQTHLLSKNPVKTEELEIIAGSYTILKNHFTKEHHNIWNQTGYWRQLQQHQIHFDGQSIRILINQLTTDSITLQIDNEKPFKISDIRIEQNELSFIIKGNHSIINYLVGNNMEFFIQHNGAKRMISDIPKRTKRRGDEVNESKIKTLKAPMPGKIIDILVKEGQTIKKGNPLMVLEAMKTENSIQAWKDTTITKISVNKGDQVQLYQLLIETD
ncbi:ATP-grasp domain-containing protein [Labilibacter sediminis]|nr:ATP-grasp domain-containing protein [Labilibacter sediminis]